MRGPERRTPRQQAGDVGDDGRDGRLHHGAEHVRPDPRRMGRLGLEGLVGRRSAVPRSDLRPHPPRPRSDRDGGRHDLPLRHRGIESAYEQAKAVAGGQNISIAGGASCAQQALKAGLVDEVDLQVSPVILGAGSGSSTASSRESRSSSWCACSRASARSTSATGWSSSTLVPLRKQRRRVEPPSVLACSIGSAHS